MTRGYADLLICVQNGIKCEAPCDVNAGVGWGGVKGGKCLRVVQGGGTRVVCIPLGTLQEIGTAMKHPLRKFGGEIRDGWRCRLQKLEDMTAFRVPPKWDEYIPKKNRHSESVPRCLCHWGV